MSLADPELSETAGQKVAIAITKAGGEKFFAGSGHTYESILKAASANEPLPGFPAGRDAAGEDRGDHGTAEAPNVVGILPGSDPS